MFEPNQAAEFREVFGVDPEIVKYARENEFWDLLDDEGKQIELPDEIKSPSAGLKDDKPELPRPIMLELNDGSLVIPEKDCGCLTHDGPHWLHMNDLIYAMNRPLLYKAKDQYSIFGFSQAESSRLKELSTQMELHHVARIIREERPTSRVADGGVAFVHSG